MSLVNLVRSGVKVADKVTKPLQSTVKLEHFAGEDDYGNDLPGITTFLRANVDWKQKQLRTPDGILSVSRAMVSFTDIEALKKATGGQGINDSDRITLQDGTTGPILDMSGFIDAGTGHPFATEVYLG